MSKATCSKCGFIVKLEETMELKEAIKYLLKKQKEHKCIK